MQILHSRILRRAAWSFFIFFVISNFTLLNEFLPDTYPHRYCADKGQYYDYELPTKRYAWLSVQQAFSNYRNTTQKMDLLLYRRFHRKWWQIWNWADFLTHERWSYPYAEKDEDT